MRVLLLTFPIVKLLLVLLVGSLVCFGGHWGVVWLEGRYRKEEEESL